MALTSPRFASNTRLQQAANNNPPMNWGEVGEPVRELQQALMDLGARMPISNKKFGSPDGIFGDETKAAVKAFQAKHGLATDGMAGKNTLEKLDRLVPREIEILPDLPVGAFITHRFRIVFRSTAMPVVPEFTALEFARKVYGMYGFKVDETGGKSLAMSPDQQLTLDVIDTTCDWDQESDEQTQLFALGGGRDGVSPSDIMVYYVNGIKQPDGKGLDGCAGHKPGGPAVCVAASGTKYAMAHEVCHVLLTSTFVPVHTPDKSNLMFEGFLGNLTADPPGLLESQVRKMRSSNLCFKV
jgi:hypothetical protein